MAAGHMSENALYNRLLNIGKLPVAHGGWGGGGKSGYINDREAQMRSK